MKHRILFVAVALWLQSALFAQLKDATISVGIIPGMGYRAISYKGSFSSQYKDSIARTDKWKASVGFSAMVGIPAGEKNRIFVGLQFQNYGFTRRKEPIRFLDTIHPDIGVRNDLAQTGSDYVDFNYRYQYLSIPFLFSSQLSGKKLKSVTLHALFGGSLSARVNHDIRAVLHGFSMADNQKVFRLEDKSAQPALFNGNLHFALRLENKIYGKHTYVFAQPTIYLPLLVANYGVERYHLYSVGVEVGIMFRPVKDKKQE